MFNDFAMEFFGYVEDSQGEGNYHDYVDISAYTDMSLDFADA